MGTTRRSEPAALDNFRLGLTLALISAFAFGCSGPFARSLMDAGWSPTAAVLARLGSGAFVMAVFATIVKPDWCREAVRHAKTVALYGVIPIAGAQLCYYNAVAHLSVGVALLLEYTAPILVVAWVWAITRRTPSKLTLTGVVLAVAGMTLVLDAFSGAHVEMVGVAWGLGAAVCAACYFVMSAKVNDGNGDNGNGGETAADEAQLHPISLAAGGLIVGAVVVTLLGLADVMPMTFTRDDAVIAGFTTSWVVPVIALGVIATAIAYTLGIMGIARLRPRFASLVGLSEVMFTVLAAWMLVGEAITATQAVGGVVVLLGLALARVGDRSEALAEATWPDGPVEGEEAHPGKLLGHRRRDM